MFSTVDSEDSRFLRCRKTDVGCMSASEMHAESGQTAPIVIPRYLSREELRARVAPTQRRLAKLAGLLSERANKRRSWSRSGSIGLTPSPTSYWRRSGAKR